MVSLEIEWKDKKQKIHPKKHKRSNDKDNTSTIANTANTQQSLLKNGSKKRKKAKSHSTNVARRVIIKETASNIGNI